MLFSADREISVAAFAGACWLPVVWMQIKLERMAEAAHYMAALPARFHQFFSYWVWVGIPAFAAMLLLFYGMMTKPLAMVAG